MKAELKITSAPALERPRDIIGILMSLIIFIPILYAIFISLIIN